MVIENISFQKDLKEWLSDSTRVVIAGIGNPIRMDDFVGVKIVQELKSKVSEKVYLIECETVPENFIQQIIDFDPSHILIIDAAVLDLKPGDAGLFHPENLQMYSAFSTHMLPLRIFCEYLKKTTKSKISLLLIEPKKTDFGEGLTQEIKNSVQNIIKILLNILP